MAGLADLVAGDIQARLGAFDGLPEIDIHHVFEVAALFGLRLLGFAASPEKLREDVAEAAAGLGAAARTAPPALPRTGHKIGEIEAAEIHAGVRTLLARAARSSAREAVLRIEAELVVHLALLGVAQDS